MIRVSYHTVRRQIRNASIDSAGKVDLFRDRLGSVTQTISYTNSPALYQRFLPYGTLSSSSATQGQPASDLRMGWVGRHGYRSTNAKNAERYVRARHYSSNSGRWITRDPFWPNQPAFAYANGAPTARIDPSGQIVFHDCPDPVQKWLSKLCGLLEAHYGNWAWRNKVNCCISRGAAKHGETCPEFNKLVHKMMVDNCSSIDVHCFPKDLPGEPPSSGAWHKYWRHWLDLSMSEKGTPFKDCAAQDGWQQIITARLGNGKIVRLDWMGLSFLHELAHSVDIQHGTDSSGKEYPLDLQCNDIFSCCIYRHLWIYDIVNPYSYTPYTS